MNSIKRNTPVRKKRPGGPRRGRVVDPKFLKWVRSCGCAICGITAEAAHVGDRGLGQKCSDREAIPLCAEHHRTGPESHHVIGKGFWQHHCMSKILVIAKYQERYLSSHPEVKW